MGRDLAYPRAYRESDLDQIVERRLIARGAECAIILRAIQGLQAFVGGENTGAARAHHAPCHLKHAEPHRVQQPRDDPLLTDVGLGREIKRIHSVQGMIRSIPHHTLEHVDDAFVGRLTQGPKQGLGFAHATMLHERRPSGNPLTHHLCCTETINPRRNVFLNRRTIWLAMAVLPAKAADYGPQVRPTALARCTREKGNYFQAPCVACKSQTLVLLGTKVGRFHLCAARPDGERITINGNRYYGVQVEGAKYGVGFGSALAIAIASTNNPSILWAIIHGILGRLYVIYIALFG